MDIEAIQRRIAQFAAERDWEQFHSPKNLTMALAGETGELIELFQWLSEEESRNVADPALRQAIAAELADVSIYVLRIADKLGIDLEAAIRDKMEANAKKYPVHEARGNATKYNRRS